MVFSRRRFHRLKTELAHVHYRAEADQQLGSSFLKLSDPNYNHGDPQTLATTLTIQSTQHSEPLPLFAHHQPPSTMLAFITGFQISGFPKLSDERE